MSNSAYWSVGSTGWAVTPGETGYICGKLYPDGRATIYKFQTQEWAELCKRSMERHDKWESDLRWGSSVVSTIAGFQGSITGASHLMMTRFDLEGKRIFEMDHNRNVVTFNVPAIIYLWIKTTWIPKAWNRLIWGEKGKK